MKDSPLTKVNGPLSFFPASSLKIFTGPEFNKTNISLSMFYMQDITLGLQGYLVIPR